MSYRKQRSGGQALVLVTLALFAMAGLMGLAVDLGWSFFVEKQAQAAADATALGAVQEAVVRIRGGGGTIAGFTCASSGTGASQVDCEPVTDCASVTATSNLNNGCQYAKKNGFDWTVNGARQKVTVQSSDITTLPPPTAPGVINISYWVTARAVQQIPQLFSAVFGNSLATVSAISTAAIAGSIAPGSLYGMNHRGDCTNSTDGPHCGTDIYVGNSGGGNGNSVNCPGNSSQGKVCAPAGIVLASSCNSKLSGVCDDGVAGVASGAGVEAGSLTVMTGGALNPAPPSALWHDANGNALTPTYTSNPKTFADPTSSSVGGAGGQPPLPQSAIGSCGIQGGTLSGGGGSGTTIQPYQFYSYNKTDPSGNPIPTGGAITLSGNITFDMSGKTCSQIGGFYTPGATQNSQFPTAIFYGGINQNGTTNFGAGQYVFAGVNSGADNATVFYSNGTIRPTSSGSSTGTMFIFTDTQYPNMSTQLANVPNNGSFPAMYQGSLGFKNADINLVGLVDSHVSGSNLPASMNAYAGIAWWQDRRNSTVGYNKASGSPGCSGSDCTGDDGSVIYCNIASECSANSTAAKLAAMVSANHVTNTSPGVLLDPGNANINLTGVYYQPRGAWVEFHHGTTGGSGTMHLQVITGAVIEDNGDTTLLLNGPTNPILQFKTTLIQ